MLVRKEACLQQDQTMAGGRGAGESSPDDLRREIARLRRTLLKHGHAQELFQQRVENAIDRLGKGLDARAVSAASQPAAGKSLGAAQLRSLVELARAVSNLGDLVGGVPAEPEDEDAPRSIREGLDLLGIRVSNLQHSFGLEPIPALGRPFDDRLHRVHGVCRHRDLPDGQVVEVLLPGYFLNGEVERPALVIVNRPAGGEKPAGGRHYKSTAGCTTSTQRIVTGAK